MFIFLLLPQVSSYAQNKRAELEQRRQELLQQIDAKNQELGLTKKEKMAALDHLEMLQDQIETREALIDNLHEEVSETDQIIDRTEGVIVALNDDYERLRVEYGAMLRRAYKMKLPNNGLIYMLSAKSFEELYKKWQYFRQYDRFRKRQAMLIVETQESLEAKNTILISQKKQKESLLGLNEMQKNLLNTEKKEKDALVSGLKADESRLSDEVKSAQKQSSKLNQAIDNIISAEIEARKRASEERSRRAKEEAEQLKKSYKKVKPDRVFASNTESKNKTRTSESSNNPALSSSFRANKGGLSSPVEGTIVRSFGKQKVLAKVVSVNNGIDIRTTEAAEVKSIFNGTVSIVSSIAGLGTVVLIQHGSYYSVYSNLMGVTVKKGDIVSSRQTIGRAAVNSVTKDSEVHFEIWLERTQLNPTVWIKEH